VTISGGLAPGESPSPTPVPSGQIGSVDLSLLVNTWPGELYNAFGFVESEDPATASGLRTVPTPVGDTALQWRNAAYAVQWWIFALFALWMWARMVRDETRRARADAEAGDATASDDGSPTASDVVGPAPGDRHRVPAGDNGARDDA
jgi:surfeit locus 1 family protein